MKKRNIITAAAVAAIAASSVISPAAATQQNPFESHVISSAVPDLKLLNKDNGVTDLSKLGDIDIQPEEVSLEIKLNKTKVKKKAGKKFTIKAKTNPGGYDVSFHSTNKKVASVSDDGVVKLRKKGTAKIVAECNGVEEECKVTVKKNPSLNGNNIQSDKMAKIAASIGHQTQHAYASSTIMCSAYSYAYAYYQVTGQRRSAGSFWTSGGCTWAGGTYSRYGSSSAMLSAIKTSLDNNRACVGLLAVGRSSQHYVTFYGYTGKGTSLSDFKILDPWAGNLTTGAGYRYCYKGYHVVTVN